MRVTVIVFLVGLLVLMGCIESGTPTGTNEENQEPAFEEIELNFFTIDKGPISSRDKGEFTLRSEFEYQSHFGRSSNGFNFNNEMIVAIYKGEVALSEHSYSVTKIVERENDILVTMTFESCVECNTSTSAPFHVIGLDRTNKRFIFEETQQN
jgi:hypothetical protein